MIRKERKTGSFSELEREREIGVSSINRRRWKLREREKWAALMEDDES